MSEGKAPSRDYLLEIIASQSAEIDRLTAMEAARPSLEVQTDFEQAETRLLEVMLPDQPEVQTDGLVELQRLADNARIKGRCVDALPFLRAKAILEALQRSNAEKDDRIAAVKVVLAKRSVPTIDAKWSAAYNAALDAVGKALSHSSETALSDSTGKGV